MATWVVVPGLGAARTGDPWLFVVLGGIALFTFFIVSLVRVAQGKQSMQGEDLLDDAKPPAKLSRRHRAVLAVFLLGAGLWSAITLAGSNLAAGVVVGVVSLIFAVLVAAGVAPFGTDNTGSRIWK